MPDYTVDSKRGMIRLTPIGDLLRDWRHRLGISQSGAALKLKISVKTLQNWEQGRRTPSGFALEQLRDRIR